MALRYYEVQTKCGHVGGRNKYIVKSQYVRAESGKEASLIARYLPRVKHHHKDAILSVAEITYERFVDGQHENSIDPYFSCKSHQEQNLFLPEDSELILDEPEIARQYKEQTKNRKKAYRYGYTDGYHLETRVFNQNNYLYAFAI